MTLETIAAVCFGIIILVLLIATLLFIANLIEDIQREKAVKRIRELEELKFPIFREPKSKRKKK